MTFYGGPLFSQTSPVDLFNDTDLSEWSGSTGNLSTQTSTTQEGGRAAQFDADSSFSNIVTSVPGDGLDNYISQGDNFQFWVYATNTDQNYAGVNYGLTDSDNFFRAEIQPGDNDVRIYREDGSDGGSNVINEPVTLSTDTWYFFDVIWHDGSRQGYSQGDHTIDVFDSGMTRIDSAFPSTSNDTHHASVEGVGMETRNGAGTNGSMYVDGWVIV